VRGRDTSGRMRSMRVPGKTGTELNGVRVKSHCATSRTMERSLWRWDGGAKKSESACWLTTRRKGNPRPLSSGKVGKGW
jgi:hypothetical protein